MGYLVQIDTLFNELGGSVSCASGDDTFYAGRVFFHECYLLMDDAQTLCERDESPTETSTSQDDPSSRPGIPLPVPSNSTVHLAHTVCPSDHWTHEFLACDVQSACWQQDSYRQWSGDKDRRNVTAPCQFPFSEMFTCTSGVGRVPYSLVCDHGQDCLDNSDEDFCVHPYCTGAFQFQCFDKQVNVFVLSSVHF